MALGGPAMLSLEELSLQIQAYRDARISFAQFENWFEDNCAGSYDDPGLHDVCISVDAALSEYHFDQVGEKALRAELENVFRPFVVCAEIVLHDANRDATSPSRNKVFAPAPNLPGTERAL